MTKYRIVEHGPRNVDIQIKHSFGWDSYLNYVQLSDAKAKLDTMERMAPKYPIIHETREF